MTAGVLVFASASNTGANFPITFPANLKGVFCIGSADGLGAQSTFSPPIKGDEKYSTPGEAILGACPKSHFNRSGYDPETQTIRRYGTSISTPIAAGIAALFIDYTWQFMDGQGAWSYENIRKLFTRMSQLTTEKDYRYLAPWSLFETEEPPRNEIRNVLARPLGMTLLITLTMYLTSFRPRSNMDSCRQIGCKYR
jgi:Subtilase family